MTKYEAFHIAMKEYARTHYPEACRAFTQGYDVGYKDALAQPAQEPEPDELTIAYMSGLYDGKKKRPWVGLTDEEIKTILSQIYCDINQMKLTLGDGPQKETVGFLFAKGIEQALREKNT